MSALRGHIIYPSSLLFVAGVVIVVRDTTAGQRSPGARRGSSSDELDVTNLPWTKKRASFDLEIKGRQGDTSRGRGDNPGDTAKECIYRAVLVRMGSSRSRSSLLGSGSAFL